MRTPIIAGNWKMNKTIGEAIGLVKSLSPKLSEVEGMDIIIAPPFTALSSIADLIENSNLKLAAQDMFWAESGAYTGAISPIMLKDCGCEYVIIAHSERREHFQETDEIANRKLKAAHEYGLIPILCIGEKLAQRKAGATQKVIKTQLLHGVEGLDESQMRDTIIAYEPVWAIGTGKTATPEQAQEVHSFIRALLGEVYSEDLASAVRIQYGGSVKADNIEALMRQEDVDGALVGGASLQAESFVQIVINAISVQQSAISSQPSAKS